MELINLLKKKRSSILERWFQLIIQSYPPDTVKFLKKTKDQFANPVGHTISREIGSIFDSLCGQTASGEVSEFLERVIKIRAIQDFAPSQSIAFVFLLKQVIREKLGEEIEKGPLSDGLSLLDKKIDGLGLMAFDIYMKSREKLYEMRIKEARDRSSRLLERAEIMFKRIQEAKANKEVNDDDLAS